MRIREKRSLRFFFFLHLFVSLAANGRSVAHSFEIDWPSLRSINRLDSKAAASSLLSRDMKANLAKEDKEEEATMGIVVRRRSFSSSLASFKWLSADVHRADGKNQSPVELILLIQMNARGRIALNALIHLAALSQKKSPRFCYLFKQVKVSALIRFARERVKFERRKKIHCWVTSREHEREIQLIHLALL